MKLRDASTGDLLPDASNDPHVCAFSVVFEYSSPTSGTWDIQSWAPTGDGSQVSSGTWNTSDGGTDESDVMTLAAGHYRLEYQADGSSNSRNKTFWVEDGCAGSGGTSGGDEPSDPPSSSPSDSSAASPTDPPSPSPSDSSAASPTDPPSASPSDSSAASPTDPPSASPSDAGDQGQDQEGDTGSNGQGQEGGVQGTTGGEGGSGGSQSSGSAPSAHPADHDGGTQGVTSPVAGDGGTKLPDTATTPASVLSPLLAALGLLLVIAAHPFIRRSALADRA